MADFETSERTRVRRVPKRGVYGRRDVYRVLDAARLCFVGIRDGEGVAVIPTFHARSGDDLLLHGAASSRLMKYVQDGNPVCVTVALLDGLVLARSLFHHSMNYRSAVVFGQGRLLEGSEKLAGLKALSDKVLPGRWEDARGPSEQELKATAVTAIRVDEASAKIRTGGPLDDDDDYELPHWAGVIPLQWTAGPPVADERLHPDTAVPDYVLDFIGRNGTPEGE